METIRKAQAMLYIDCQALQGENSDRGIGRYIVNFISALAEGGISLGIIVNSSKSLKHELINAIADRYDFPKLIFDPCDGSQGSLGNINRRNLSALIYESVIGGLTSEDTILIPSFYEGFHSEIVISVGSFLKVAARTVGLCHDIIPCIFKERYPFESEVYSDWYWSCTKSMLSCEMIVCNSACTQKDISKVLGYPVSQTAVIYAGRENTSSFDSLCAKHRKIDDAASLHAHDSIVSATDHLNPYILAILGDDPRKNTEKAVQAFCLFRKKVGEKISLVIVGDYSDAAIQRLRTICHDNAVADDIYFVGRVSENKLRDLKTRMSFLLFPSLYEGFGLPLVEAYSVGRPVVASASSALAELSIDDDLLVDPKDAVNIADKMYKAYLAEVDSSRYIAESRNFTWHLTAQRFMVALADTTIRHTAVTQAKETLAWLSPMPPEKSGISYYSLDLSTSLLSAFSTVFICGEPEASKELYPWLTFKSYNWFKKNESSFKYKIFNMGNSSYHVEINNLLRAIGGSVILHDYYLSGIYKSQESKKPSLLLDECIIQHGLREVVQLKADADRLFWNLSCNMSTILCAEQLGVHSRFSYDLLVNDFLSQNKSINCLHKLIHPRNLKEYACLREQNRETDEATASKIFTFISFGIPGTAKLTNQIIDAWISSGLNDNDAVRLVIAGEYTPAQIGAKRFEQIRYSNVLITGWLDDQDYDDWLSKADVALQLRQTSRGETSGTVLDCLSAGLPVIVSDCGPMAEYSDLLVTKISNAECDSALPILLLDCFGSYSKYKQKSLKGIEYIKKSCTPQKSLQCIIAMLKTTNHDCESYDMKLTLPFREFFRSFESNDKPVLGLHASKYLGKISGVSTNHNCQKRRLFVECSMTNKHNLGTGIQRVVTKLIMALIHSEGYDVIPVYIPEHSPDSFRFASGLTAATFDLKRQFSEFSVEPRKGDVVLLPDLNPKLHKSSTDFFDMLVANGVALWFVVHDIIGVTNPEFFQSGAKEEISEWLKNILPYKNIICVSKTTAEQLTSWVNTELAPHFFQSCRSIPAAEFLDIRVVHLAGDLVERSTLQKNMNTVYEHTAKSKSLNFLMVGTFEPRKGHLTVLRSFSKMSGMNLPSDKAVLTLVGRDGWLTSQERNEIDTLIELNQNIVKVSNASDADLIRYYCDADYVILSSYHEGFGLPFLEAAALGKAIICRDIPIFRELQQTYSVDVHWFNSEEALSELLFGLVLSSDDLAKEKSDKQNCHINRSWSDVATEIVACFASK